MLHIYTKHSIYYIQCSIYIWSAPYINRVLHLYMECLIYIWSAPFINPRRACAARVTVVGSVCPLSHISPMERLFVLKTLSRTQLATKVKKFVGFSLKPLRCRDPALPPLYGHAYSPPFFLRKARMRIIVFTTWWTEAAISCLCSLISIKHVFLRRGFCTLVLSLYTVLHLYMEHFVHIWRGFGNFYTNSTP